MHLQTEVLVAVIGAISALLAPRISFLLQRQGLSQKAKEVEVLDKRAQIIERLLALERHLSEARTKQLQAELAEIAQDVIAERARELAAGATVVERLSFLRRALLVYEQPTMRASVYRGFYWFFLSVALVGGLSVSLLPSVERLSAVIGGLFYVVIGLLFRSAARRQQKRTQARAAAASAATQAASAGM